VLPGIAGISDNADLAAGTNNYLNSRDEMKFIGLLAKAVNSRLAQVRQYLYLTR